MIVDRLKFAVTAAGTGVFNVGAAVVGARDIAMAVADGDMTGSDQAVPLWVDDQAGNWERSTFNVSGSTITRVQVQKSSAGGAAPTYTGASIVAFSDPDADYLNGQSLSDYLAANPGGTVQGTDTVLGARGNNVVGFLLSAVATYCATQWRKGAETIVQVGTTAALTLDSVPHNRNRLKCTATPSSITPAAYSSIGDGFTCRIDNLSGADITLSGMTVRPSGGVIPSGGWADVWADGGTVYADVGGLASGAAAVAPGAVASFTAGTSGSTTQVLNWTAPTTGTSPITYLIEYTAHGGSTWTQAATGVSALTYTVTSLTASTAYDYRITPSNGAGAGPATTLLNVSTTSSAGTGAAPFAASLNATFPTMLGPGQSDSNWFWGHVSANSGETVTISNVAGALSVSNTTHPDSTLSQTSTPEGNWIGNLDNYGGGDNYLVFDSATSAPTDGSGTGKAGIAWSESARDYYYWIIVTDSNNQKWYFVSPRAINIGGSNNATAGSGSALTMTQVA